MQLEVGQNREWFGAQASLKFFTVKFLGLKWNDHYDEWRDLVDSTDRGLIQAPRGSRKTYFFSLSYPLWRIIRGKTDILMVSDSEDQSRKNLRLIREKVEQTPALSPLQPSTRELWGTDQAQFKNGSLIEIMGFGTSKRGIHPNLIINDDIESERNKMSREDKNRMYFAVIMGMAISGVTQVLTIGTPLDFQDILEQIENLKDDTGKPIYKQWKRPALVNGVSQFPDLWSAEDLVFKRTDMGSLNFAREMLLQRIDPATAPFKREYETIYKEKPTNLARIVTVCDPAYSETDGDATAIVTVGFTHGNHAYVLDAREIRRDQPGLIVDELFKVIRAWEPDAVGIEKRKGEAVSYSFEERRTRENRWDFEYVELSHGGLSKGTRAKMTGGLIPRWEARSVHVHNTQTRLLEELYAFRFDDLTKGHDDLVDALAYCFHPDMARPNGGKRHAPTQADRYGRPLFRVGADRIPAAQGAGLQNLWRRLDRRVGDVAA